MNEPMTAIGACLDDMFAVASDPSFAGATSPVDARVPAAPEHLAWTQLVDTYAQVTGKPAKYEYTSITDGMVAATPDALKLYLDMTRFVNQYGANDGAEKTAEWVDLGVKGRSWADFVKSQL